MIKENVCFTSGKLIVRAEVDYLNPLRDKTLPQLMLDFIFFILMNKLFSIKYPKVMKSANLNERVEFFYLIVSRKYICKVYIRHYIYVVYKA